MDEPKIEVVVIRTARKPPLGTCYYSFRTIDRYWTEGAIDDLQHWGKWVCMIHGQESKHEIHEGSVEPCLAVDPYP